MPEKKRETIHCCLFASERYWTEPETLEKAAAGIEASLKDAADSFRLITSPDELPEHRDENAVLLALPLSGAVQQTVLRAAEDFPLICLFPGYVEGNLPEAIRRELLLKNAAPAVMDVFGVLKRDKKVLLSRNRETLRRHLQAARAWSAVRQSKILLIGKTEDWVISNSRDLSSYSERLGTTIEEIPRQTLVDYTKEVPLEEAEALASRWQEGTRDILEVDRDDIVKASRVSAALEKLLNDYEADGAAIGCFDLLKPLDTSSCLAVSHINNDTDKIAACEGDMDSALTMLMMKKLSGKRLWMANPNLQKDESVNFVHCTAPVSAGGKACPYCLRNHHESGMGVSPQVDFPDNAELTVCRLSDEARKITIQKAVGRRGPREASCRTQMRVYFEDYAHYLESSLGCHQVFAFGDITEEMKLLAQLFDLEIV